LIDTSTIISLITLGAVIIGAVVNVSSLVGKRESKAASDARLEVKLDNIFTKVDSIEKKQTSIESTINAHGERIRAVEESTKSAHHRIDGLEGKKKEE
jgi:outer membrane murein-binding lipoprotein Lpp